MFFRLLISRLEWELTDTNWKRVHILLLCDTWFVWEILYKLLNYTIYELYRVRATSIQNSQSYFSDFVEISIQQAGQNNTDIQTWILNILFKSEPTWTYSWEIQHHKHFKTHSKLIHPIYIVTLKKLNKKTLEKFHLSIISEKSWRSAENTFIST